MFELQKLLRNYFICLQIHHGTAVGILELSLGTHTNIRPKNPPEIITKIVILSEFHFDNL